MSFHVCAEANDTKLVATKEVTDVEEGKIVAEYRLKDCVVRISDAAFAQKTPAQLERDRAYARQVACRILQGLAR